MHRLTAEKDASERDSREKETKVLNLTRQLEELRDRLTESERLRAQQQRELDDLTSSQDDAGKNVCVFVWCDTFSQEIARKHQTTFRNYLCCFSNN